MSTPSWGGYRQPSSPAAVSGPGGLSARTDGGVMNPNSPSYGDTADVQSLQQAAPTSAATSNATATPAGADPLAALVGMGAPSQDQLPVTAGAAVGAGPGPDALGLPQTPQQLARADVKALGPGFAAALVAAANRPGAPPSTRALARAVIYS